MSGDVARSHIAHLMLQAASVERRLGSVYLRDHQVDGVARVMDALNSYGGALLCDEVGLGKTFTAAAVAQHAGPSVIIAPAALVGMWRDSLGRAGEFAPVISLEKFSRTEVNEPGASLVIIDEAHHLRNRNTARFRNVAAFIGRARVLLLSATPLHNKREDVHSLLSLFLGSRSETLAPSDEARCVIRRRSSSLTLRSIPTRVHCEAAAPPVSDLVRRSILGLPPPVPPRDGDDCAALVQFTLAAMGIERRSTCPRTPVPHLSRARVGCCPGSRHVPYS